MLKVSSGQSQGHRDASVSSLSAGQYLHASDHLLVTKVKRGTNINSVLVVLLLLLTCKITRR